MTNTRRPEVGDVYLNTQTKNRYVILAYHSKSQDFIGFCSQTLTMRFFDKDYDMSKHFKYLGKSKVNISQIFEVEND